MVAFHSAKERMCIATDFRGAKADHKKPGSALGSGNLQRQSSARLPSPHIFTIFGSNRATISTKSCWCFITSTIFL